MVSVWEIALPHTPSQGCLQIAAQSKHRNRTYNLSHPSKTLPSRPPAPPIAPQLGLLNSVPHMIKYTPNCHPKNPPKSPKLPFRIHPKSIPNPPRAPAPTPAPAHLDLPVFASRSDLGLDAEGGWRPPACLFLSTGSCFCDRQGSVEAARSSRCTWRFVKWSWVTWTQGPPGGGSLICKTVKLRTSRCTWRSVKWSGQGSCAACLHLNL